MAQHSAKGARFQAVTANLLTSGEVVYWSAQSTWTLDPDEAKVVEGAEAAAALLADATPADVESRVLDPYLFEVVDKDGKMVPASVRETIRAAGPTIRPDLGKQANQTH